VTGVEEPRNGGALMGRGIEVPLQGDLASAMIELNEA
jgi:hypothetical protein